MTIIESATSFALGAFNAMAATIIGAAGGHKPTWSPYQQQIFRTGTIYHFVCSFGMMFSGIVFPDPYAATLFQIGVLLFCGPLYHTAFTNVKKFTFLNPFGGMSIILAWGLMAYSALSSKSDNP